jgi:Transcriptional regulators
MTSRKLAALAEVSPATISKVFSGSPEISVKTAERIKKLAEENGWCPPKYRKNFKPGAQKHVSILLPELISVNYGNHATAAVKALRSLGIEPDIHIAGFTQQSLDAVMDTLNAEDRADGILLINTRSNSKKAAVPVVGFEVQTDDSRQSNCDIIFKSSEDFGMKHILDFLHKTGHTKIAFISETNTNQKLHQFKLGMAALGLPVAESDFFVSDKRFEEIGYDAVSFYLDFAKNNPSFTMPTAFVCAYDEVAFGAMRALQNAGIHVPRDISVVGMNDIAAAQFAEVPLSTVRTFSEERINLAARLLTERIFKPEIKMKQIIDVPFELVIRSSTAPPRTEPALHVLQS